MSKEKVSKEKMRKLSYEQESSEDHIQKLSREFSRETGSKEHQRQRSKERMQKYKQQQAEAARKAKFHSKEAAEATPVQPPVQQPTEETRPQPAQPVQAVEPAEAAKGTACASPMMSEFFVNIPQANMPEAAQAEGAVNIPPEGNGSASRPSKT